MVAKIQVEQRKISHYPTDLLFRAVEDNLTNGGTKGWKF